MNKRQILGGATLAATLIVLLGCTISATPISGTPTTGTATSGTPPTTGTTTSGTPPTAAATPVKAPTQLWSVTISAPARFVPYLAVSQGLLYYNSPGGPNPGQLIAVSASDGKTVHWKQSIGPFSYAGPVVDDNLVFDSGSLSNDYAVLFAFDAQTGAQRWSYTDAEVPGEFQEPSVVNGVVFVASYSKLFALNEQTGGLKWSVALGQNGPLFSINGSPLVVNGVVYAGGNDGKWYAFDAASGKTLWSFTTQQNGGQLPQYSSGVAGNGIVYFSTFSPDTLYAVRTSDHSLLWKRAAFLSSTDVAPVVTDNSVLFEGGDPSNRTLIAFDPMTGQQQWKHGDEVYLNNNYFDADSQILVVNGVIYCGGGYGLFGFATDGTPLWSINAMIGSQLVLVNGVIYDGTVDYAGTHIMALSLGN